MTDYKVIEKIDENTDIIYFYVKSPNKMLVAHRSFCQIRVLRKNFPKNGLQL